MALDNIAALENAHSRRLKNTPTAMFRYLYNDIDWNERLIGIKGPRGCGKTTLMLQHIKEKSSNLSESLYISLDNLWFSTHDVIDLVDYFYSHGGRYLYIDEVHYYPKWQTLLKNIYDDYPEMNIVFSGSSMMQIDKGEADLSRRLITHTLQGLSFREYLAFEGIYSMPALELEELLQNHIAIAMEICGKTNIIPVFEKYCREGYYPFYKQSRTTYAQRLQQVVAQVLENDYPMVEEVEISTIRKARKMLMILAERVPQIPNMTQLFRELETDRNQGLKMLYALQQGGLLNLVSDKARSLNALSRPDKIYLNNCNLMYALTPQCNTGMLRETFFLNQLKCKHSVTYPKKGDFLIDDHLLFEIGGRNKTFEQIKDEPDSYLAIDGLEYGSRNRIPLWMFGLLY